MRTRSHSSRSLARRLALVAAGGAVAATTALGMSSPSGATTRAPTLASAPAGVQVAVPTVPGIGFADRSLTYCEGLPATIIGTNGADDIWGTAGNDVIVALGGDDRVWSGGGHDKVCLGPGDDKAYAGSGDDVVRGGHGDDSLHGMDGIDLLMGDEGDDGLIGGAGGDYLYGGDHDDWMSGDQGEDHLSGGSGKDTLDAAHLDDGLPDDAYGGPGDDLIFTDDGIAPDLADGDAGSDTCYVDGVDTVLECEGP